MNNNPRGIRSTSEKQSFKNSGIGTRHSSISTPNNNIHININLNVKKKSNCYHGQTMTGKKINNFIEVSDTRNHHPVDASGISEEPSHQVPKTTALGRAKFILPNKQSELIKNQKAEIAKKQEKIKRKKTKQKIASKPYTPQKHQKWENQEKSRSKSKTGKKLAKKKQSKSMENLKVFKDKPLFFNQSKKFNEITHNNAKLKSGQNSSSKEKSRSKSNKKSKKNRSSSKDVVSFQNSGIKKVLVSQKSSGVKNGTLENMRKSKKSLKGTKISEKDMIKINQFMEQKKQDEQRKKKQRESENSSKAMKIKDETFKSSKEKKQMSNEKEQKGRFNKSHSFKSKAQKYPMFFGDEDQQNEGEENSQHFKQERQYRKDRIIQNNRTPQKANAHSKNISPESTKKNFSATKKVLRESTWNKFQSDKLTKRQTRDFYRKITKIQAWWRGCLVRQNLIQHLSKLSKMAEKKKKTLLLKKGGFWDDDENDSIINLENLNQKNTFEKKMFSKASDFQMMSNPFKSPQNSNFNSCRSDQNDTNHKKYQSESDQDHESKFFEKNQMKICEFAQNGKSIARSSESPSLDNSNFFTSQIEMLRKQIEEQNKKFQQLERENTELRQNLKYITVQKQREKDGRKHLSLPDGKIENFEVNSNSTSKPISPLDLEEDSVQIYELKRPVFQNSQKQEERKGQKFKNLKIQTQIEVEISSGMDSNPMKQSHSRGLEVSAREQQTIQSPSSLYVQNLKRQLQAFESPSNRSLKSLEEASLSNMQKAFKKKELSIDMAYEKSSKTYQQMLQNNIVSPKTYNFKKIELDEKYKRQKQEISLKFKEAEKVIKFISEEVVQEERAGEDQSPQKSNLTKENHDEKIRGVKADDFEHISEKIEVSVEGANEKREQKTDDLDRQIEKYEAEGTELSDGNSSGGNFRKYWTEDMDEVHKRVLEISNKIDEALESDSRCSESLKQSQSLKESESLRESDSNKEYSSQNSNFNSVKSTEHQNPSIEEQHGKTNDFGRSNISAETPIYEELEYRLEAKQEPQGKDWVKEEKEREDVMGNESNLSSRSDKSSKSLSAYDIHYPSPTNKHAKLLSPKHHFEVKNQSSEECLQPTIEGNNSLVSQNRSSLSSVSQQSQRQPQNRGFDTRLTFIKEYCIALCEFIRSEEDLKEQFISNISMPLKYDYLEYLKSYRTTLSKGLDSKYNSTIEEYIYPYFKMMKGPILQKALNDENTSKFDELYNQNYNLAQELSPRMLQIRAFFIKAIIDVFNESLDFQRPGSIYGEPLPWLVLSKNLKNNQVKYLKEPELHKKSLSRVHKNPSSDDEEEESNQENEEDERLDKIFGIAIAKIIQWGSCLCGFIPEPVSFDGEDAQAVNIDEEQTNLVRQTRLAYMLEKSLTEDEERMIDNTMEQLEVQLQVQQMVFYEIVSEMAQELSVLSLRQIQY